MIDNPGGIMKPEEQQQAEQKQITDADLPNRPNVKQVAAWLGKSQTAVYGWARNGLIPCKRVRRTYIFDKAALLRWAKPEEA